MRGLFVAGAMLLTLGCTGGADGSATATPDVAATPEATRTASASPVASAGSETPTPRPTLSATPQRLAIGLPLIAPKLGRAGDLDADGLPSGVVGPLVVYQREVSSPSFSDPWVPGTVEVVTVDLGRNGVEVGRVRFGGVQTPQVELGGGRLVVEFGRVLRSYAVDGSDGVELWRNEAGLIERMAVSPDGVLVAVNEFERWDCDDLAQGCASRGQDNRVLVLDTATGEVVLEVAQDAPRFDGFGGVAGPSGWSDDGMAVELGSFTYSEAPGSSGVLGLDGSVTVLEPSGRFLRGETEVVPAGALGCALGPFDGYETVRVLDAESGAELNAFDAGAPLIDLLQIAPDGSEVLIGFAQASSEQRERLLQLREAGDCNTGIAGAVDESPRELVVLGTDGAQRGVASRLEVYARWFEGGVVSFACGDLERAGFRTSTGRWWSGGDAYGIRQDSCEERFELRVNGEAVGTGAELWVLGFVER